MSLLCQLATQASLRAGMPDPASWLGATEQARLAALGSEARRQSFVAGRWLARLAVQRWCGSDYLPRLAVANGGACQVVGDDSVFASISHSGEHLACAVAALPVGVDLEHAGRQRDYLALARLVHNAAEQQELESLAPAARASLFLQAWTRKEAWLKARGQGLDFALMRSLSFVDDPEGDTAVAEFDGRILAIAADPALPPTVEGLPMPGWRRCRARRTPAG